MKAGTAGLVVRAVVLALRHVWTATGLLSCTSDGFLRVTIGTQTLDVPVSCTG